MEAAPVPAAGAQTVTLTAAAEVQRLDVAVMHEKALGILASLKAQAAIKKKHVKSFFENIVHTNPSNDQQVKGNCMCCSTLVVSTGSFKFVEHLTKCSLCPRGVRDEFLALNGQTEAKRSEKRDVALMAREEAHIATQEHNKRQMVLKQQCIRTGMKQSEVAAADLDEFPWISVLPCQPHVIALLMKGRRVLPFASLHLLAYCPHFEPHPLCAQTSPRRRQSRT